MTQSFHCYDTVLVFCCFLKKWIYFIAYNEWYYLSEAEVLEETNLKDLFHGKGFGGNESKEFILSHFLMISCNNSGPSIESTL